MPKSAPEAISLAKKFLTQPQYALYRNFAFFSSASLAGNFFAFLFHFLVARRISVADYGTLSVLLALFGILILPFGSFASLIVKKVAQKKSDAPSIALQAAKISAVAGCAAIAFSLLAPGAFASIFHVFDPSIPLVFAFALALAFVWTALNGVLQGLERFYLSGTAFALGSLAKLAAVFLLAASFGLLGAVVSYGAAFLVTLLICSFAIASLLKSASRSKLRITASDYLQIALLDIGLALLFNGDLVVLGNQFPEDSLGFYSAGSTVAKIISYALLPLAAVAFPKMVEQASSGKKPKAVLATLALVGAGGAAFLVFYSLLGAQFLSLLYSEKYLPAVQYLLVLSLSTIFYCANMALSRYFIAVKNGIYTALCLAVPLLSLALLYSLHSVSLAPFVMLGANAALFASGAAMFLFSGRTIPGAQGES